MTNSISNVPKLWACLLGIIGIVIMHCPSPFLVSLCGSGYPLSSVLNEQTQMTEFLIRSVIVLSLHPQFLIGLQASALIIWIFSPPLIPMTLTDWFETCVPNFPLVLQDIILIFASTYYQGKYQNICPDTHTHTHTHTHTQTRWLKQQRFIFSVLEAISLWLEC
jgi:hypothetical protein